MAINPKAFKFPVVTDTCSVWNLLSSRRLFQAARSAKVNFYITEMVRYECILKPRKSMTTEQNEMIRRYKVAESEGCFPVQSCQLEDLVMVGRNAPLVLSSGELSCIAIAYRDNSVAVMTDEKRARSHAESINLDVETTPRLYAWLHFYRHLADNDHHAVIEEHERYERRPLTKFLQEAYEAAMQASAMDRLSSGSN